MYQTHNRNIQEWDWQVFKKLLGPTLYRNIALVITDQALAACWDRESDYLEKGLGTPRCRMKRSLNLSETWKAIVCDPL